MNSRLSCQRPPGPCSIIQDDSTPGRSWGGHTCLVPLKPRQVGKRCVGGRLAPWLCDLSPNLTAIYHFGIVLIEPRDGGE